MTIQRISMTKARVEHRCAHCLGVIEIGETYYKQEGLAEGHFYLFKAHEVCEAAAKEWANEIKVDIEHVLLYEEMSNDGPREFRHWLMAKFPEAYLNMTW